MTEQIAGKKLDQDKTMAGLLADFPRALQAVAQVGTFGAKKYSRGNWLHVQNGVERYKDAKWRHMLEGEISSLDPESGFPHKFHEVWNALAELELLLIEKGKNDG